MGFGELMLLGGGPDLSPTVTGENVFSPSYFQMREFFICFRKVQAA